MSSMKLYYTDNDLFELANQLMTDLVGIVVQQAKLENIQDKLYLILADNGLTAVVDGFKPFHLDIFYNEFIAKRRSILNRDLLLGALNFTKLKNIDNLSVLDMTGGLGRDSILFALAGFNVTISEINPYLVVILRYLAQTFFSILGNINVIYANGFEVLQSREFDFVYYDPMFEDGKHALAKKDMQIIDKFIAYYNYATSNLIDNNDIIKLARLKSHKFIVKRDNKQEYLVDKLKPTYQKKGKTIRFDVYQGLNKLSS